MLCNLWTESTLGALNQMQLVDMQQEMSSTIIPYTAVCVQGKGSGDWQGKERERKGEVELTIRKKEYKAKQK